MHNPRDAPNVTNESPKPMTAKVPPTMLPAEPATLDIFISERKNVWYVLNQCHLPQMKIKVKLQVSYSTRANDSN